LQSNNFSNFSQVLERISAPVFLLVNSIEPVKHPVHGFPFGQSYTYQVLPFGLKTAVGSFSRSMDVVLGPEVREYTINYIDDLLIVSNSFEEHLVHLGQVL
jgi:hypothetical protein